MRGEDVLEDAPRVMGQVARWLGLRSDAEAVAAMLRPEESPYAALGPDNAPFGNDPKFVACPAFRPGKPRLPRLEEFYATPRGRRLDAAKREYLSQFAACLGYA